MWGWAGVQVPFPAGILECTQLQRLRIEARAALLFRAIPPAIGDLRHLQVWISTHPPFLPLSLLPYSLSFHMPSFPCRHFLLVSEIFETVFWAKGG